MIIYFTSFLLFSFSNVPPSDGYPVGMARPDRESQRITRVLTKEMDPDYSVPMEFDGEEVKLLKGEGEDQWMEGGEQDLQELSPNTADTMRKINPLTIADQVSQIFRKGSQKANLANKSGGGFMSPERGQETLSDQSLVNPEGADSPIQPGYVRQAVPRIVNKPRSNDYGYSVIVLAGDAVHLPIKVQGKSVGDQGRGTLGDKDIPVNVQNQGVYRTGEAEERISLEERAPKKEIRVYKQYNKNPDFPVYDEDLNFVPDPFQGILDENYRLEVSKDVRNTGLSSANFRPSNEMRLHRVHIRSDEDTGSGDSKGEKVACGSWGKGNATDSEVISPLSNDDMSDDN